MQENNQQKIIFKEIGFPLKETWFPLNETTYSSTGTINLSCVQQIFPRSLIFSKTVWNFFLDFRPCSTKVWNFFHVTIFGFSPIPRTPGAMMNPRTPGSMMGPPSGFASSLNRGCGVGQVARQKVSWFCRRLNSRLDKSHQRFLTFFHYFKNVGFWILDFGSSRTPWPEGPPSWCCSEETAPRGGSPSHTCFAEISVFRKHQQMLCFLIISIFERSTTVDKNNEKSISC